MTSSIRILYILFAFVAVSNAWSYDETLATEHAALSFAAYCPSSALYNWNTGYVQRNYPDIKNVQVFEDSTQGTKGYIAYNAKQSAIIVVFRGSSNIQNWISNINFTKMQYNTQCNCQVHKGFLEAYYSLRPRLDQLFTEYTTKYPYAKIHLMGHSLGGAMATFYATYLSSIRRTAHLSTFGSPRVGDPAFYDWFEKQTSIQHYRVVHESDTVPHLPLYAMGFYHVNREIWYHGNTHTICQPTKGEDHACSYSVKSTSNADHSLYMGWSSTVDC